MSNYYLCDRCRHYCGQSVVAGDFGYCNAGCNGYRPNLRRMKVMYDYGRERGYARAYDDPLDVCADFELREES